MDQDARLCCCDLSYVVCPTGEPRAEYRMDGRVVERPASGGVRKAKTTHVDVMQRLQCSTDRPGSLSGVNHGKPNTVEPLGNREVHRLRRLQQPVPSDRAGHAQCARLGLVQRVEDSRKHSMLALISAPGGSQGNA